MRARWMCVFVALTACTSRSDPHTDGAGLAANALGSAALGRFHVFDAQLRPAGHLAPRGEHVRLEGPTVPLEVLVPRVADGELRVATRGSEDWASLSLRAVGVAPSPATVEASSVVYRDVAPATDAIQLVEPHRVEEVRVLRDSSAPTTFVWRITRERGIARLRVREGVVEALDAEGRARLRMERPFAIDANGTKKSLAVRLDGDLLVLSLDATGLAHPIAVDPAWGPTTSMNVTRAYHRAVKLASGKVLVVGGEPASGFVTSTAEIYDGGTRTWTLAASMSTLRAAHGLVPLPGGKVLVVGGRTTADQVTVAATSSAEIYDPATDAWTAAKSMNTARSNAGVLALPSGKIAVLGGVGLMNATVYDPTKDTWTDSLNSMPLARTVPMGAVVALGGKAFFIGGNNVNDTTASIFDPAIGLFTSTANFASAHGLGLGVALSDGRAMMIGGVGNGGAAYGNTGIAEVYNPLSDTWSATPAMPGGPHTGGSTVLLPDGRVFAISGTTNVYAAPDETATDLYDPIAGTWKAGPAISRGRVFGTASLLADGSVVFAGGDSGARSLLDNVTKSPTAQVDALAEALPKGSKCSASGACTSGACAQSYCCDRPCTGACESCDVPGKEGTCTILTGAVGSGKAACSGSGGCAGTCDGSSPSCTFPVTECVSASCVGGVATAQAFCDGAGTCASKPIAYCGDFACGAVTCKTSCAADGDCVSGKICEVATGKCVTKKARGATCTKSTECTTGFCADGLCCDKACDGACEACDVTASEGVCTTLDGVPDKHGKCGSGPCADVCKAGACSFKSATTACGAACVGSMLNTAGNCSGLDDKCAGAGSSPCPGNYACEDATKCRTKCFVNADCAAGFACDIFGNCLVPPDAGAPDSGADTFVPPTETGPSDTGIGVAESGTKLPDDPKITADFQRCTKDNECSTGHCVEGVCCDTACTDRCKSCALLASPGKCTLEPIGVDLKNECGPSFSCLGTCDGTGQCIGAGTGTMCSRNKCTTGSKGVGPAYCAAPGAACNDDDVVEFDCMPYACEPAFGACLGSCKSSDDCANGFVCDVSSKTCVAPEVPEASSGCAVRGENGASPDAPRLAGIALALAALGLARRKRS
ncbi:MAG: hypothetical protein ACXWUE_14730 [Polyangiales bacterium]